MTVVGRGSGHDAPPLTADQLLPLLRTVLDATPSAAAIVDARGTIVVGNRAWDERDSGGHAPVGANYLEVVSRDPSAAPAATLLGDVLAGRRPSGEVEHPGPADDRWMRLGATALPPPLRGALVVHDDITTRRQAAALELRSLEQARREAQVALAGGIAHDFNNLLTGVTANVGFLRMSLPVDPDLHEALADIEAATTRATELCRQMLAFSGRGRFVLRRLGLGKLVRDTAQLLRVALPRAAALELDVDAELPELDVDAGQVQALVTHLLVAPVHADALHVALEVTDAGAPLAAEQLRRTRDPLLAASFTGRGLAGVLGAVRNHHGGLYASSTVGATRWRVLIPVGLAFHLAPPPVAAPAVAPLRTGAAQILVVDDEELLRRTLARVLEHHGHRVQTAASGAEALAAVSAAPERYQLVLLDLTMPKPDGVETLVGLRRLAPRLPVLMMSGFTEDDVAGRFSAERPTGYVQKPVDIDALLTLVNRALPPRA